MIVVVDASALVAIAAHEPERLAFLRCLERADEAFISSVNVVEAGLAIVLRLRLFGLDRYAAWLEELGLNELDVSGAAVLQTYLLYGKGVHQAALNLGDCYAYTLAKQLDASLLYKGRDFVRTDVRPALQPT